MKDFNFQANVTNLMRLSPAIKAVWSTLITNSSCRIKSLSFRHVSKSHQEHLVDETTDPPSCPNQSHKLNLTFPLDQNQKHLHFLPQPPHYPKKQYFPFKEIMTEREREDHQSRARDSNCWGSSMEGVRS